MWEKRNVQLHFAWPNDNQFVSFFVFLGLFEALVMLQGNQDRHEVLSVLKWLSKDQICNDTV